MYGIISDVSIVLSIHEDQHVSFEYSDVEKQSFSMVPIYRDCESDPKESHEGERKEPHISTILAQSFSPFNFSSISSYPHRVLGRNKWDDYLPRFRGSEHDEPGKHLFNFHVCILEHDFVHKDFLINMFKFSLEGYARECCQSLPSINIHCLK
jgi:hypothetical protein